MKKVLLIAGLILFAYPLYVPLTKFYLFLRFELMELSSSNFSFYGKKITITDTIPRLLESNDESIASIKGKVIIKVDTHDISSSSDVDISPELTDLERYQMWIAAFQFKDRLRSNDSVVIVQRLDEVLQDHSNVLKIRFRYIYIPEGKPIGTEILSMESLNSIASSLLPTITSYKVQMANYVRPQTIYEIPFKSESKWVRRWHFIEPFAMFLSLVTGTIFLSLGFRRSHPISL